MNEVDFKTLSPCRFNFFVDCEKKDNCDHCGWNPIVHKKRIKKYKEKRKKPNE